MVDRRIDMLPELLGSNLCSLRANEERFAFSVLWEMTPQAEVVDVQFTKSIILSRASLTYQMAQDKIDHPDGSQMAEDIRVLLLLSRQLKKRRTESGALVLASPAMKFVLDRESHDPIDMSTL